MDADTFLFGSDEAMPRSCVCVRVLALRRGVRRAGLPGAFYVRLKFLLSVLSSFFARPLPSWGCPFLGLLFAFLLLAPTYDFVGHSAAKTAFTLPHWI